ncbi:neuronal growth regulator 1 isoform X1 [Bactrocera neohumeralis]|uniref:neuronal growth regulator 1 isoform X1 n=1 Tax=Bactrocera neohumeralis TaxID=98809 RepID=UPI00216668D9|nr:neuronal growth regulator 1 isoform X1 [Bactrocera neohumeralis]
MMTTAIETTFVTRQVASTSVTTLIRKSSKSNRTNPPSATTTITATTQSCRTPTETRDRPQSLCTRSSPTTRTTKRYYHNRTSSAVTTCTTGRRMRRLLNAHLVITATTLQQCAAVRWQLLVAFLICNCIDISISNQISTVGAFEPDFVFPLENVTVAQGRDATFTCVVNNLGGHRVSGDSANARVAWIKADAKAILAIHEHVITNNDRLSVTHNDFNTWTLVIRNVRMDDSGKYMCQVNTDPMKMQTATLEVVIPPDIVNEETSGDMMVPEGGSAKLVCRARGHPKPKITWRREDGREIIARNGAHQKTKALAVEGEMLALTKVTRSEMGAYMCIASNGVPPSVSKRMKLQVHFHPLVQVPNQLVGAPVLTDVTLVCNVEASPKAINYWQRENGEMIIAGDRYVLTEKENNMYSIEMILHIRRLQTSDFGGYKCISKNSIGDTEGTIRLYEMERPGKKNQREDDNEVTKNDATLKDSRHEDGSRNQNGRLYKERGSDAELQSAGQTLSRRWSTQYLLALTLFVSLATSATTTTITTKAVTMVSRRSLNNL